MRHAFELALLGLLACTWGSSYLFIKLALVSIPPVSLIALRVAIAALFLLAAMRLQGERLPKGAATWRMLLVQAFFNSIASWTLLAWGQQYVDSGLAGVLNSTAPLFVFFITLLVTRHEALSGWKLAGAALGVAGVVLVTGTQALGGLGRESAAQAALLAGAFLYGCAAIYGKRFAHLSPTVAAAGTMIWATLWLVPLSLAVDQPWNLRPTTQSLLAALVLAILCTGCALILYFRLARTLGSMGVASQGYLRAGVSVLLGVVVLDEQFAPLVGLGLLCVILGVAAINLHKPGGQA
jgi:drug/metabolite transporter (DMT)-like permease